MDVNKIDQHLNAVLRAAGSALRHYSLPKSLDDMRAAMKAAIDDATLELQARVAELEAERAERAAQKPVAQIDDDECFQGPCRHATAFVPMPRGTPLYTDPPVAATVRLTGEQIGDCIADDADMQFQTNPIKQRDELLKALTFYAEGNHFIQHDPEAWDTVSGEPQNFREDEANTATVEDGSIARTAIAKATGEQA